MHCPVCGQQQVADTTRYCSRCGFLLTGIAEVIANGGIIPQAAFSPAEKKRSPRAKGVRQGALMILLCFFITPVLAILHEAVGLPDELVALSAVVLFWGGILRMIYAAVFEEGTAKITQPAHFVPQTYHQPQPPAQVFNPAQNANTALPPQPANFTPANNAYTPPRAGVWRAANTGELVPPSVTENTTKLLDKQEEMNNKKD